MNPSALLPADWQQATLVGRLYDPADGGPSVVVVRGDELADITQVAPTMSDLLDAPDPLAHALKAPARRTWPLHEVLAATTERAAGAVRLEAPIDLQVIKAAGVTFAKSMVERVIEERASGDPDRAAEIRAHIDAKIGGAISDLSPGTPEAAEVKRILLAEGLWSQYLEVGIGPDPEIFTKAPVLSAVGTGAEIGVLARSTWNNPEPEIVLIVSSAGRISGVTLGNDVNLRDIEGRSALLLPLAKDNNASCAVGPFIRLLDQSFTVDQVRELELTLTVTGADGYVLREYSKVSQMSRSFEELVGNATGPHHQYPDGFALFTGTLFAPTQDRDQPGMGFTHKRGDIVEIQTPTLGTLVNTVTTAEDAPDWHFGIRDLMRNLHERGLLTPGARA